MAMGSHVSIITLNINGLNAPTKRQRLAEWIKNKIHIYVSVYCIGVFLSGLLHSVSLYMLPTRNPPQNKGHMQTESEGLEKDIPHK